MKQIDYQMLVKYADNSSVWVEDNSAIVRDNVTIAQHAKETVQKYNKRQGQKKSVFIIARKLPAKYIIKLHED